MLTRLSIVFVLLAVVLATPFAMRRDGEKANLSAGSAERLVIITPHNQSIQAEFGRAFVEHMKREDNRDVFIDWRQPGGTSEIAKFLQSEYSTRFETLWEKRTGLPFSRTIREGFLNGKIAASPKYRDGSRGGRPTGAATDEETVGRALRLPPDLPREAAHSKASQQGSVITPTLLGKATDEEKAIAARTLFLTSDIGSGIDLFFGGGAYDFDKQAAAGILVAKDASGEYGPGALAEESPDWFSDEIMPEKISGEPFRDPEFRWVGAVLSAFGICYNTDVLERLGIEDGLTTWEQLTDPRLFGQVALADPTKSGSTTKAFEMLIQERIQSLDSPNAVEEGWNEAMRMILKISANARYFTDYSPKVPRDVAFGDAAAGMCIDFYGRTFNELYRDEDGRSRIQFTMPRGGTSIGADPIGMLRGAPNPELAHRFIEFVLSPEGQKLWNYRVGTAGGPARAALRRPPIRRDFYTEENRRQMSDPDVNPYEIAEGFTYHPEWTGSLFSALRLAIRAAFIEPHDELQAAWGALIEAGMPSEGVAEFEAISEIDYETVVGTIQPALSQRDKIVEVKLAREVSESCRKRYLKIAEKYGRTN